MASTPTPPPHCSSIPARPTQNSSNHHHHHQHQRRHHHHHHHNNNNNNNNNSNHFKRQNNKSRNYSLSNPSPLSSATPATGATATVKSAPSAATTTTAPSYSSPISSFVGARKSRLSSEFSGRRSTRVVSKMHTGRPRISHNNSPHSIMADEALHYLMNSENVGNVIDGVLLDFEHGLIGSDYVYLIRELGDKGQYLKVIRCYDFAMWKESSNYQKGKLCSAMISALGRMGKVEHAQRVFEMGKNDGYGRTVYSFSSMISTFGRNRRFGDAVGVLRSMENWGLTPNEVTYNAVIDAGAKAHVEFDKVVKYFDEMIASGVQPDRFTYNSLISVCVPGGLWEVARDLFHEMEEKGINRDIYTYNTYLDVLCKGGRMDLARNIMTEMPAKRIFPNVVTYSTLMDGYAKAGRLEDALNLVDEMKFRSIRFDRVSYNTLVAVYGKLGWFEDALNVCKEMESSGISMDVVTYNALLGGYGKHGMYDEFRRIFEEMKAKNIYPNVLTYSTMIDVYTKGGMYREAMDVFREFKQSGLEADVVFYSALIDALCKNGLVESSMVLLDVMTQKGIRPNVVTYNSIIDAFGQSAALECGVDSSLPANKHRDEPSSSMRIAATFKNQVEDDEDRIMKMFEQLAAEKAAHIKKDKRVIKDKFGILSVFQKMHELRIKPNVVTFSAILNACSRCNSFEDASKLLDQLRLFDNQVYGVAHGLLMGYRERIWFQAQSLFNEIKHMDSSTASAFYNALTDVLWHFGQKRGAQLVVVEGRRRNVWHGDWSDSCLDLHLMSCGAACAMVHAWLLNIRTVVFEGCEPPKLLSILTGWGKHSKVVGDGTLRRAVEALLNGMGAPFRIAECNIGRFVSPGPVVAAWLRQSSTLNVLILQDNISKPERSGQVYNLQALCS